VIEIKDLYKFYAERRAVGPLSCSIEDGEIVGLLGLNGAGKTTTLRILACDLLPSSGSVTVDGLDVVEEPHEVRKRVGYLPDTPPLYPEMTVGAYLRFAARLRGLSRAEAERRVPEVEAMTELSAVSNDPISSLSHGYKQRVGIAQAIVHRPKLLVLDEPISGLDPVQIVEMRKLLRSLRGEHTIILSSHILTEISETCDRLLVIKNGEIVAAGSEAELTAQLLRKGVKFEITLRAPGAHDYREGRREELEARSIVEELEGVQAVEVVAPSEPGDDVLTLRVEAEHDVREALCAALVQAKIGVRQIVLRERELESVFLRLAGAAAEAPRAEAKAAATVDEADDAGDGESKEEEEAEA